jgi:hypothetical protein
LWFRMRYLMAFFFFLNGYRICKLGESLVRVREGRTRLGSWETSTCISCSCP